MNDNFQTFRIKNIFFDLREIHLRYILLQEAKPHWSIDLGKELYILKIQIIGRKGCCFTFKNKLNIFLGPDKNRTLASCKFFTSYNDQSKRLVLCEPTKPTRVLTISTEDTNEKLVLCEVNVFGTS